MNLEELADTSDPGRRGALLTVLVAVGRLVPTGAFAFDHSRFDFARPKDDVEVVVEALRAHNLDNTRGALIAVTAVYEQCALVTNEHKLTGRAPMRRRGGHHARPAARSRLRRRLNRQGRTWS